MFRKSTGLLIGILALTLTAGTASAATSGQLCASAKKKAAGKKAKCKEGCDSKAIKAALPFSNQAVVDCNGKCTAKFSAKWDKTEAKGGCATTGDKSAIEGKVDTLQSDLRTTLGSGGPSKCTSSVYKEAGKKAACKLKCHAKAQKKGLPPSNPDVVACLNKCTAKFSDPVKGKCPKAVAANDCINAVNCPAIEARVDLFVDDTVAELPTTAGTSTSTTTSTSTSTTSSSIPACNCCANTKVKFTTGTPDNTNCGVVKDDSGGNIIDLKCAGLYFGGGADSVPLPSTVPDMGSSITKIVGCSSASGAFTLAATTDVDTGSNRDCTAAGVPNPEYPTRNGCLFGPPLPIANAATPGLSTCVVNRVTTSASGSGDCDGGTNLALPLGSDIYLTGDLLTNEAGIQPCPLCTGPSGSETCEGGPNNGMSCTPGDSDLGDAYPTSHDCPPPHNAEPCDGTVTGGCIGTLPIPFQLQANTVTKTATDFTSTPAQSNVFCGFCGNGFGAFANPAVQCSTDSNCAGQGLNNKCRQKTAGAFGTNLSPGAVARTIQENGTPSGCVAGGGPLPETLVSVFCIPPTFNPAVDSAADLPGPGAVALKGVVQALP
jgi:hypothetical protein